MTAKCPQASEITSYLRGEVSEEERAMLRSHYEHCDSCARELAKAERIPRLPTIAPSADFKRRTEQAFLKAHPQFAPKRFTLLPRLAAAAAVVLVGIGAVMMLRPTADDTRVAVVTPEIPRDVDPTYEFIPKSTRPATVDAVAWGDAAAVDSRLLAAVAAPRYWDAETARALKWLSSKQEVDGSWKGGEVNETIELTGLAVLALNGTNDAAVRMGADYLISRQRDSGAIGGGSPESHGIATLALLEASIREKNAEWAKAAAKAVAVIAQQNHDGPWGRGPVAAWQYHALRLAEANGDRALVPVLVRGWDAAGSGLWTDPAPDREAWAQRVSGLLQRSPLPGASRNDIRLAYFCTTLLRPLEGDAWTKWWSPLRAKLLRAQSPDGSWPDGFEPGKGPIYATAFAALILQSPQRLPTLAE